MDKKHATAYNQANESVPDNAMKIFDFKKKEDLVKSYVKNLEAATNSNNSTSVVKKEMTEEQFKVSGDKPAYYVKEDSVKSESHDRELNNYWDQLPKEEAIVNEMEGLNNAIILEIANGRNQRKQVDWAY